MYKFLVMILLFLTSAGLSHAIASDTGTDNVPISEVLSDHESAVSVLLSDEVPKESKTPSYVHSDIHLSEQKKSGAVPNRKIHYPDRQFTASYNHFQGAYIYKIINQSPWKSKNVKNHFRQRSNC